MRSITILAVVVAVSMVFSGTALAAETVHLMSFQGQAADDTGEPLATGNVQVRIYDAATEGTLIYDSGTDFNNAIQEGIFDVLLGSGAENELNLDNTVKYYLEVSINNEEVVGDAAAGRQGFWPGSGDHAHAHDDLYFTEAECNTNFINTGEAGSITSGMIAAGAVSASNIASGAVGSSQIQLGGVSASNIASGAVGSSQIQDNSVTAADLYGSTCSEICNDANTTDCASCDSRFVNETDLDHLDASGGSPANAVYVDTNGNVGIGTTTPVSNLSVGGSGYANTGIYGSGTVRGGYFEATDSYGIGVIGDSNYIGVYGEGNIYGGWFTTYDTNSIDYGVFGQAGGNGGDGHYGGYFNASGATTNYGVFGQGTSTSGGTTNYGGYFYASGATTNYGVRSSGTQYDFYADGPGTDYGTSSSIRWKQNISEIDNALNKVLNLRGVYFDWDEEHGGQHDMGMIAEEVGEIVPEVVQYEPDGLYADGMDYGALTPILVEAIKEQNKIVEEQKGVIAQLKELVCLDHPDAEVCAQ